MSSDFELAAEFPVSPSEIYEAWLDGERHAAMTGSPATASDIVGGEFVAWDGYCMGTNLELEPGKRIVQSWRTTEFTDEEPDSRLEISLEATDVGTKLTLRHSVLPEHGEQYKQGWMEAYFEPMLNYFGS